MKQLEKTDAIVSILDNVFDTIRPLHDDGDYVFITAAGIVYRLKNCYNQIYSVNMDSIMAEIWEASNKQWFVIK